MFDTLITAKRAMIALCLLMLCAVMGGATTSAQTDDADLTMIEWLQDDGDFDTLLALIDAAEMTQTFNEAENVTLFAPFDEVFEVRFAALDTDLDTVLASGEIDGHNIEDVLNNWILAEPMTTTDLVEAESVTTVQGTMLYADLISIDDDSSVVVFGDEARDIDGDNWFSVLEGDIETTNGLVHVVDWFLLPPDDNTRAVRGTRGTTDTDDSDTVINLPENINRSRPNRDPIVVECIVRTEDAATVQVRVGPGNNRGVLAFLPADRDFDALSQFEDADGGVWYQLDPTIAAPAQVANQTWVSADDVDSTGNCDALVMSDESAVVRSTSSTSSGGEGSVGSSGGGSGPLAAGTYQLTWSSGDSACGIDRYVSTAEEVFGVGMVPQTLTVSYSGAAMYINGVSATLQADGQYFVELPHHPTADRIYFRIANASSFNGLWVRHFIRDPHDRCSHSPRFVAAR